MFRGEYKEQIKRKDIYWVNFKGNGRVQKGRRPAIILTNDEGGTANSPVLYAAPITKKENNKRDIFIFGINMHVDIGIKQGLEMESIILVEQATLIDREDIEIENKIGVCPTDIMKDVNKALLVNLGLVKLADNKLKVCIA